MRMGYMDTPAGSIEVMVVVDEETARFPRDLVSVQKSRSSDSTVFRSWLYEEKNQMDNIRYQ
jgi:hypothetical protein